MSIFAKPGIDPYEACSSCVAASWCKARSGEMALPPNYPISSECGTNVLLTQALELSGIPEEYINANKRNYIIDRDNEEHEKILINLLGDPTSLVRSGHNVALIHNNKGTGKTYTTCAILNEFIYRNCTNPGMFDYVNPLAMYVKYGQWSNDMRRAHQVGDSELFDAMYRNIEFMKKTPLLAIDDIGSGRITDFIRDLTYDVIDYRKEKRKTTIFTSNFVDSALSHPSLLGDMIVSRLMYRTIVVQMRGRDRRAK